MKKIISTAIFIFGITLGQAAPIKHEKTLEIKAHILRMMISSNNLFRLELKEFAAVYHADQKFVPCLQQSIKENKEVTLKVASQSLVVQECKVD